MFVGRQCKAKFGGWDGLPYPGCHCTRSRNLSKGLHVAVFRKFRTDRQMVYNFCPATRYGGGVQTAPGM